MSVPWGDIINQVAGSTYSHAPCKQHPTQPMEKFAINAEAAKKVKRTRCQFDDDFISKAVTLARHVGATSAAVQLNSKKDAAVQVSVNTIDKWIGRWKKEGDFWKNERSKRGRPNVIAHVEGAKEECVRQLDALRAQGESVTGHVASVIAKAVISEKAPSLLEEHGGPLRMVARTGARMLAAQDKSFRKASSSRVLPPLEDVAAARDKFYSDIVEAFPGQLPSLDMIINFDQTFHLYNPTRGFTWEKRGADRVALRQDKDGFTLLPVISSVGMIGAQLIFGGSTQQVFPKVDPHPVLHYTCTPNHWSNGQTTVALWKEIILPYIAAKRVAVGDPKAPVLVLADAFAAHWCPSVTELIEAEESIAYIGVPESLTHLFQPLDLGVIAALKNTILRRKDDFLQKEVQTAVKENRTIVLSRSRPVLREKLTMWIKEALMDPVICAEKCCKSGFERAGVLRALFGEQSCDPDVDSLIPRVMCDECGEPGIRRWRLPPCAHFAQMFSVALCDSCVTNHATLCDVVGDDDM